MTDGKAADGSRATGRHANNWDNRYDHDRFFYGEEPNYFVASQLASLPPGRGLFLAEGEGRNAVYAATLGHDVAAVDSSAVGARKALEFAARRGVTIDYRVADVVADRWDDETWDFVVLCFAHLDPAVMADVHRRVAASLKPGGRLILNSFATSQWGRKSGGPPRLEWLHDLKDVKSHFPDVAFDRAVETEVDLNESVGHRGLAMVLEVAGVKRTGA